MDPALQARITAGKNAVLAHTELMHREFGRAPSQWKHDGTRVTSADLAISAGIVSALSKEFPEDQHFSEELAVTEEPIPVTSRFCWVLDPIDGTNNYATGISHCAISLALLDQGIPVYGLVYDMARRTLIHGGPEIGLWDGDRAVSVKKGPITPQSMLGFHSPFDKSYSDQAKKLVECFKIRGLGSSTLHLAYVAVGILDATVDHNVKIWDIAAAVPLCQAGGGNVEYFSVCPFPMKVFDLKMKRIQYLAGNAEIVGEIRTLLGV